jgi:hypothetical protein
MGQTQSSCVWAKILRIPWSYKGRTQKLLIHYDRYGLQPWYADYEGEKPQSVTSWLSLWKFRLHDNDIIVIERQVSPQIAANTAGIETAVVNVICLRWPQKC